MTRWRGSPVEGVTGLAREVLPLLELRSDFTVSRSELQNIDRGAVDADFDSLDRAARQIAIAENTAVTHGWADLITEDRHGAGPLQQSARSAPIRWSSRRRSAPP